jgi:phenylacetic acid degradation operon negative regulatory protein
LLWLGFGTLDNGTWISPRDLRSEVEKVVDALNLRRHVEFFSGEHRDFSSEEEIVARCWDLESLNDSYAALITHYDPILREFKSRLQSVESLNPAQCFFHRFLLIHEYRSSPYVDPNLPLELLPDEWHGEEATKLFQELHELLVDGADEYVDSVLVKAPKVDA